MPFPLSSQGTILSETTNLPEVVAAIEAVLRQAKPSKISATTTRIDFRGGLFRLVSNWNLLVPIGSSRIEFRQRDRTVEIRYHISFVQLFVIATMLVIFIFGVLPMISSGERTFFLVYSLGLIWLWLFGLNYFIAVLRFPAALRNALENRFRAHATSNTVRGT